MSAILLFEDKICERGVQCLMEIERVAGRECLTKGYVKIQRICAVCTKVADASKSSDPEKNALVRSCVLFALQALRFSLHYELLTPKRVTVEEIDTKRDGTPGLIHVILARMFVVRQCRNAVAALRGVVDAAMLVGEMDDVMQHFLDYPAFEMAF